MKLSEKISNKINTIPDFPKPGIQFKDITPLFTQPDLVNEMATKIVEQVSGCDVQAVAGIESRGFLLGPLIAQKLNVPFVLIRKAGKLPGETYKVAYDLEYGHAALEIQKNGLLPEARVLVHDDLLATGGTALAAMQLVQKANAQTVAFSSIVNLSFLPGTEKIATQGCQVFSLVDY